MFQKRNVSKIGKLLARGHAKLKNWHVVWHVGTPSWNIGTTYGTLALKNEKLARFCNVGTQTRWHVNHAGMQTHWHVDHVGKQARMARDLANSASSFYYSTIFLLFWSNLFYQHFNAFVLNNKFCFFEQTNELMQVQIYLISKNLW